MTICCAVAGWRGDEIHALQFKPAANAPVTPFNLNSPHAGSCDPVVVHLDKPVSLMAQSLIAIRTPERDRMAGEGVLGAGETIWRFVPRQAWRAATYVLATHPDLEDSAGNRPCGPFEAVNASSVRCDVATTKDFRPRDAGPKPDSAQHVSHD